MPYLCLLSQKALKSDELEVWNIQPHGDPPQRHTCPGIIPPP